MNDKKNGKKIYDDYDWFWFQNLIVIVWRWNKRKEWQKDWQKDYYDWFWFLIVIVFRWNKDIIF